MLIAGAFGAAGQSCLKLVLPHDPAKNYYNPDSVRVDTCANPQKYYAKEWFEVTFTVDPFAIPQSPRDSVIERTWLDIDTSFTILRTNMSRLDSAFGTYYFRKKFPDIVDTVLPASRTYLIRFNSLVWVDSAVALVENSSYCQSMYYQDKAVILLGSPLNEPGTLMGDANFYTGAGFTDFKNRFTHQKRYHKFGMQYHLWAINAPMAWDITEGKPEITIAVVDIWKKYITSTTEPGHGPNASGDLYMRIQRPNKNDPETGTEGGNFIYNEKLGKVEGVDTWVPDPGQSTVEPRKLQKDHGMECTGVAVAMKNEKGMLGVAPKCRAIGLKIGTIGKFGVDVDSKTAGIQPPDVFSCSYIFSKSSGLGEHMVKYGSVVVSIAEGEGSHYFSNNGVGDVKALSIAHGIGDGYTTDLLYTYDSGNLDQTEENSLYHEKKYRPFRGQFIQNEYKNLPEWVEPCLPLCQVGSQLKKITSFDHELIAQWNGSTQDFQHYYDGNFDHQPTSCETIAALSPTIFFKDKFALLYRNLDWDNYENSGGITMKHQYKLSRIMDVVAPTQDILLANYDGDVGKYWVSSGPSYGIPQIAGTVALMKSVDKFLGAPLSNNLPENPLKVAAKAFDIVTFTAKKVIAASQFASEYDVNAEVVYTNNNVRVKDGYRIRKANGQRVAVGQNLLEPVRPFSDNNSFVVSENDMSSAFDPLQRSFSNTCGYGLLDAFRCVAHAIPDKNGSTINVQYAYNTNASLDWTNATTVDTKKFLHLGKFKNSTDRVLEKGGNRFNESGYTEPIWKNNHGKTVVNTGLSVGNNQVLVIDGILTTDGTAGQHTIETTENGKILITGYLKNVNLEGNVRFADLNVYSIPVENSSAVSSISIKPTTTEANKSEVYGAVTLFGGANLTVEENATLTIMPGGSVNLNGTGNVVVKNGATLSMKYASSMTQSPMTGRTPRIIIESGGKLVVESKARAVELLAMVQVQEGGEFIIEDNVGIKLYGFKIESDGLMKVDKGSDIELISNKEWYTYWNKGKLLLNDSTISSPSVNLPYPHEKRVTISGKRDACGNVIEPAIIYCTDGAVERTGNVFTYHGFLNVRNTDFMDVKLSIKNMKVTGDAQHNGNTIESCTFTANSTDDPDGARLQNLANSSTGNTGTGIVGPLLQVAFDRPSPFRAYWDLHRAHIDRITVKGCTFKDNAGSKANPAVPQTQNSTNKERYHVSGVSFMGMYNATDENCYHNNLRHGVYSDKTDYVLVHRVGDYSGDNFKNCDYGVFDYSSSVKTCNNGFNITAAAVSLNGSSTGVIVENSINNVSRGTDLQSTSIHHHRENDFNSYLHGVSMINAYANLRPIHIVPTGPWLNCEGCPPPTNTDPYDIIWGRNNFSVAKYPDPTNLTPQQYNAEWAIYTAQYKFLTKDNFGSNADGFFPSTAAIDNSTIAVTCGYNLMAQYSTSHFGSERGRSKSVAVSYNRFLPPATPPDECVVRVLRLTFIGTNRCVEEDAPDCPDVIAEPRPCSELPSAACPDSIPNDGSWALMDAGDSRLSYLNTTALSMLGDSSLDSNCRRIKAFDALQTAFLLIEDSTRTAVSETSNAFASIIADTSEPASLRSTAMLLKADLHERLGEYDSAAALYGQHAVTFDSTGDTRYAAWRADALAAYMADTTQSAEYDSLMLVLNDRIFEDKFGAYAPSLVKRGNQQEAITGIAPTSLDVQPNPFDNTTQLQWRLNENAYARVIISDAFGREVSVVFEGYCNSGAYTANFNGSELPIGVYYCRLETMGKVITRQIILIR